MDKIKFRSRTFSVTGDAAGGALVEDASDAGLHLRGIFSELGRDREHFVVLALNARGRAFGFKVVGSGTLMACLVHPRDVFRAAIVLAAATVIVAHNHPSGDPTPSEEDRELTERLRAGGALLGIPLVDSLVVVDRAVRSCLRRS